LDVAVVLELELVLAALFWVSLVDDESSDRREDAGCVFDEELVLLAASLLSTSAAKLSFPACALESDRAGHCVAT
jgi:hypothetical protein